VTVTNYPGNSSAFNSFTYDDETNECTFVFHDGRAYTATIPQKEFDAWMASDSKGEYFNFYIRGNY
jgi:hypothetical protein